MSYFLWGCRRILTLITLRGERVKGLQFQDSHETAIKAVYTPRRRCTVPGVRLHSKIYAGIQGSFCRGRLENKKEASFTRKTLATRRSLPLRQVLQKKLDILVDRPIVDGLADRCSCWLVRSFGATHCALWVFSAEFHTSLPSLVMADTEEVELNTTGDKEGDLSNDKNAQSVLQHGKWTRWLVLSTCVAVIGSSMQFGYNTTCINAPEQVSWISRTI